MTTNQKITLAGDVFGALMPYLNLWMVSYQHVPDI